MTDPADISGAPARRRWRRRPLWHFFGLPAGRRLLLVEAVTCLALSRLALLLFPFRAVASRFGTVTPPAAGNDAAMRVLNDAQSAQAREIGWAVTRAARYVPFRAVCLPQAIAAQAMLRRRRVASVMHFGVAKSAQEPLSAHAWLDAGQVEVTGYPVGPDFVEIARFV